MNRPDKAGEPSMDEILASIRQIIAEEPGTSRSARDAGASPPPPKAGADGDKNGARAPALLERLNGVLKNTPPVGGPLGSKRPLPFDQDLADMFDDTGATGSGATAAPKPEIRVAPELGAPSTKAPPAGGAAAGGTAPAPASAALPPQLAPSAPLVPPPPSGTAERSAAAPRPSQTFGFPPLTNKRGFYPPQRSEPVLAPIPGKDAPTPAPGAAVSSKDANTGAPAAADADDPLKRLGAIVPSEAVGGAPPTADSAFGAPPRAAADGAAAPAAPSLADVLPKLDLGPLAADPPLSPASATPEPLAPAPTASEGVGDTPVSPVSASAKADAAPSAKVEAPAASLSTAPTAPEKDAAAQALDALAQGLAASAAASALKPDAAAAPAAPLNSAAGPVPEAAARLEPAVPVQAAPAARTLEDAVADMLRPMLQQWVADNMPRIMEKALRVEMTRSVRPGTKPPGS